MFIPSTLDEPASKPKANAFAIGEPTWRHDATDWLYMAVAGILALIFIYDLATPLGVSEWVFYCVPVVVSFLLWHPYAPFAVAAIATVLSCGGFLTSPEGIDASMAFQNRSFGVITCWILATAGYFFIRGRLALKRKEWIQAGQVGLARATGGDLTLTDVGDRLLRFLAEYLHASTGAIFVENGGGAFSRTGGYAIPATSPVPESIRPGEGLLGQAIKDGRPFVVNAVPDGYLYFGSSLGVGKPSRLLVAPAGVDGRINAVMEFGLTDRIGPAALELLQELSQPIGVTIRSAQYRARLHELLEETRRQAEELQEQQEELRAANEELEQQSRSLEASQARLEESNKRLEEQTRYLEEQRSDLEGTQSMLKQQAKALEQASRYKTEFLANMSHELRTPLNSALIMARLLADNRTGNLSGEQVKYAETIESAGNDLLALINDILDLSKIEAGRIEIQPEDISIGRLADKLARTFQPMAANRKLAFAVELMPDLPESFHSDPLRLEQILKNFLSNAVKFTEQGSVTLRVERSGNEGLSFAVVDTGIGIPPQHQDAIFEAFRQADGTTNRKYGGTGLGLSISRELARLLGGDIHLTSEVGTGSEFKLVVPLDYDVRNVRLHAPGQSRGQGQGQSLGAAAPRVARSGGAQPLNGASRPVRPRPFDDDRETLSGDSRIILVVEDDVKFARILFDLAHEQGFQCLVADTAEEGIEIARQYLPHAIILDIGLPDHSGLSVLDRLKHNVRTRHIPVHVVSMHDYTQTALEWGAIGYMLKPVKREALVQALVGFEERLNRKMRRVLVVEDDDNQLASVRALLEPTGVDVTGVRSGAECLKKLDEMTYDCMVLDLSLPDMSGLELLERLSTDEDRAFPPVIVYTGRDLNADEELALRRYSKSIIIKGAKSPERLLDEVTLFLHHVVSELPAEQQRMLAKSVNRDGNLEGRRILVVEDDIRNVFALTSVLEPQGASVEIARNGLEAITALERAQSSSPVDLVLMDVMMPEMDGITATKTIREREEWKNLPIIVLTAKAMPDDQEQCIAAGANDYMAKPLDVEKLLSLVRVWIPR